jgi:hypothetical protein
MKGISMFTLTCQFDKQNAIPIQIEEEVIIKEWTSSYMAVIENTASVIDINMSIPAEEAWYLSYDRKMQPIYNKVIPPFPVGCLLVIKRDNIFYQIDLPKYPYMQFKREKDGIKVSFSIKDLSKIGLPFWGKEKIKYSKRSINLDIMVYKIDTLEECTWIEPYPNGAKAAICLTDHADWDSVEKLRQLTNLFEKYNFKFTKSIFPHSDPEGHKNEPGLDNLDFKKQVDRLHNMGTEIAYHSLSPRINPPAYDECLHRITQMKPYSPTTWIDHGTGSYLYSRKAKFSNDVLLVEVMAKNNIVNYWSYIDIWENPSTNLNVWAKRTFFSALQDVVKLSLSKGMMKPRQFAYIAVGMLKNMFGGSKYRQLKKIWKPSVYRQLMLHAKALKKLHEKPFVIYDEDGYFALNSINKNWIFDTILLNHLALQLKPKAIDDLVKQNGLLVAHCYMGAQHKYGGSNCFNADSNTPVLLSDFENNIAYISYLQERKELISLSFKELRQSYVDFMETKLIRNKEGWDISGQASIGNMKDKKD